MNVYGKSSSVTASELTVNCHRVRIKRLRFGDIRMASEQGVGARYVLRLIRYVASFHVKSTQKNILTPPDLDETWFLHSVYRDIKASYVLG